MFFLIIFLFLISLYFGGRGSISVWDCARYLSPLGDRCQCLSCTRCRMHDGAAWICGGNAISLIAVKKSLRFLNLFWRRFRFHGTQAYSFVCSSNGFGETWRFACYLQHIHATSMNGNFDEWLTTPSGKHNVLILPFQCCLRRQWQQTAEDGSVIRPAWLA